MRLALFPFHTLLLSLYPILNLYAKNVMFIPFRDTVRSMAWSLGLALFFTLAFRVILRDWAKAGALCSLLLVLFYSFGHVAIALERWGADRGLSFDLSVLGWIWLGLFLLLSFLLIRRQWARHATPFLNLASGFLTLFPVIALLSVMVARLGNQGSAEEILSEIRGEREAEASMPARSPTSFPDIYYIIVDAYVRADVLEAYYDYENRAFIEALESRGFYVASGSHSNYLNTTYSLNTSLNLLYFHEVPTWLFREMRYNLERNHLSEFLRERGYQVVVFDSGTGDTNYQYADLFLSPHVSGAQEGRGINPFEHLLFRTTLGVAAFERRESNDPEGVEPSDLFVASVNDELSVRRERIRFALDHLADYAAEEGRFYVFAHLYLPHFPFLYGPEGEELRYHKNTNLYWYEVEPEDYAEFYTYQVDYLNAALMRALDRILEGTTKPVVIILQADHGDERFLNWEAPSRKGVHVRSAILNAIYFSDGNYQNLYPTLTPVNTFRLTLNQWFGTQYPLLPDRVYFHEPSVSTPHNRKPAFLPACPELGLCLPDHSE
jgi:hypothetical protein